MTCHKELKVTKAVVVADVPDDDDERSMVGGTAMVAEFHRRCVPHTYLEQSVRRPGRRGRAASHPAL